MVADACYQGADTGPCRASIPRFYYNARSGRCDTFNWGGMHTSTSANFNLLFNFYFILIYMYSLLKVVRGIKTTLDRLTSVTHSEDIV